MYLTITTMGVLLNLQQSKPSSPPIQELNHIITDLDHVLTNLTHVTPDFIGFMPGQKCHV